MNDVVIVKDIAILHPPKSVSQGQTGGRLVHNFNELW